MSQENIEIVREFFSTWNAGDLDRAWERLHPDVVMRMEGDWPEPGPYFGREAVHLWDAQFRETWDEVTVQITDIVHSADRVVGRYALRGIGKGPVTELEVSIIHTIRDGRIREIEFHWDHIEALRAVGLSE